MVNEDRIVQEFLELVQIDSVSREEGRIKEVLKNKLLELGLEVYEDDAGKKLGGDSGNLMAWLPGSAPGPSVFFCAHMDTVEPGKGVKPVVQNGLIESSGETILGGDDKAGIAAIVEALRVLKENNIQHPPLEIIFTVGEEQGLMGSKHLDFSKVRSRFGYVLDSVGDPGTIITRGPTQNEIEIDVLGKAAHAGINPQDGINAIAVAAYAISHLKIGRIDEETTCNIGIIAGGKARNIVPDRVVIRGEARSLDPAKLDHITHLIENTFKDRVAEKGGRCKVNIIHLYPQLKLDPLDDVVKIAVEAARAMGVEPVITKTGGGSDANLFNGQGIKCANLGIGMRDVHTVDEHIEIKDLVGNARYLLKIIEQVRRKGV
ncbi:MAG: M20/M25/M40 family metallo-hydrolase [Candidatus Saccharibacteria bacterium]